MVATHTQDILADMHKLPQPLPTRYRTLSCGTHDTHTPVRLHLAATKSRQGRTFPGADDDAMAVSTAVEAVARPRASTAAARTTGDSDASASLRRTRSATQLPEAAGGFNVEQGSVSRHVWLQL